MTGDGVPACRGGQAWHESQARVGNDTDCSCTTLTLATCARAVASSAHAHNRCASMAPSARHWVPPVLLDVITAQII